VNSEISSQLFNLYSVAYLTVFRGANRPPGKFKQNKTATTWLIQQNCL